MAFKAVAAQTGGDFSLMERTVPPGARTPPPHRHVNCSEAFFVLAGTITFRLDDADLSGSPGDFLLVPRGACPAARAARPGHGSLLRGTAPALVFWPGAVAGGRTRADEQVRNGTGLNVRLGVPAQISSRECRGGDVG
jgi:hypothetical protein